MGWGSAETVVIARQKISRLQIASRFRPAYTRSVGAQNIGLRGFLFAVVRSKHVCAIASLLFHSFLFGCELGVSLLTPEADEVTRCSREMNVTPPKPPDDGELGFTFWLLAAAWCWYRDH